MSEEMVLHQDNFKRRKLDKVGDNSRFDTDRVRYEDDDETGGLGTGFTDSPPQSSISSLKIELCQLRSYAECSPTAVPTLVRLLSGMFRSTISWKQTRNKNMSRVMWTKFLPLPDMQHRLSHLMALTHALNILGVS